MQYPIVRVGRPLGPTKMPAADMPTRWREHTSMCTQPTASPHSTLRPILGPLHEQRFHRWNLFVVNGRAATSTASGQHAVTSARPGRAPAALVRVQLADEGGPATVQPHT